MYLYMYNNYIDRQDFLLELALINSSHASCNNLAI